MVSDISIARINVVRMLLKPHGRVLSVFDHYFVLCDVDVSVLEDLVGDIRVFVCFGLKARWDNSLALAKCV